MKIKLVSGLLLASLALSACDDDDSDNNLPEVPTEPGDQNPDSGEELGLVATIQADDQFNTLESLVVEAGLADVLASGEFTVFAPTDAAFSKLPDEELERLRNDKTALAELLKNHVVPGKLDASAVTSVSELATAADTSVGVEVNDGSSFVGGAKIIKTNISATNGIVHVIDRIILGESTSEPANLVDLALLDDQFSTLVELVGLAELGDVLAGEGPFTVFAPTNAAFEKIPAGDLEALKADKEALRTVLLNHVVSRKLLASDVVAETSLTAAGEGELTIDASGNLVKIGEAQILRTDLVATNGVAHVIDSVLLPTSESTPNEEPANPAEEQTITELAKANSELETVVTLIEGAGLADTLNGPGPFTVFAPVNSAFEGIEDILTLVSDNTDMIRTALLNHVVDGSLDASMVLEKESLQSKADYKLDISEQNDEAFIGGAKIIQTDIKASNGVIHLIDTVIFPEDLLQ